MSEYVLEAVPGGERACSPLGKTTAQGEGIYASSASADVGPQQMDQIGLTISPKKISGAKLSPDACMITDQDFEDALKQLEPLLKEAEGRTTSFRILTHHGSRRHHDAPLAKRRKLSRVPNESFLQNMSSSPVIRLKSASLCTAVPVAVYVHAENSRHDDGNEILCPKTSGLPSSSTDGSKEAIQAHWEDIGNSRPSLNGRKVSIEEPSPESAAFKGSHLTHTIGCRTSTTESDCYVLTRDLKCGDEKPHDGQDPEKPKDGTCPGESASFTGQFRGKMIGDHGVPLLCVKKESQQLDTGFLIDMRRSRSFYFNEAAVHGVLTCYLSVEGLTIAGSRDLAANEMARNFGTSQDSLQSSRTSLQTSTLASIARLILQNSQQAFSECSSKSLQNHQIPTELRKHFDALLRKFQSDNQFQKAVASYAMEITGVPLPGDDSFPLPIPPRLRQAFDSMYKKYRADDQFTKSVDKFALDFLKEKKSLEPDSSGAIELEDDMVNERMKSRDLDPMSREELIRYCKGLEFSRNEYAKAAKSANGYALNDEDLRQGTPRIRQNPAEPKPSEDTWTCFHPKIGKKNMKQEHCGRSNPHYEKKVVWQATTHCKTCKGPYHERFKLLQTSMTPQKKNVKTKDSTAEAATPSAPQYFVNAQVNDFHTLRAPSLGASSGEMYGNPGEDENSNTGQSSLGWNQDTERQQHVPMNNASHSTPIDDPFSGANDGTTQFYPMHDPGFQNANIGNENSPGFNMPFTAQDGEFGDVAIDSDPLFMATDVDADPQQAASFVEEPSIFPEDFPQYEEDFQQYEQSSEQFHGHYPAQVNLFPQQTGSNPQSRDSSILPDSLSVPSNAGFGPYQSPYAPTTSSTSTPSANFGENFPVGTMSSYQQSSGMVPLNPASAQPQMQIFLSPSQPDRTMTHTAPATVVPGTDSKPFVSGLSWRYHHQRNPHLTPKPRNAPKVVKSGRGKGWNIKSSPTRKRPPRRYPRKSRSKEAVAERAERAAEAEARSKAISGQSQIDGVLGNNTNKANSRAPLTQAQMHRVQASNNTAAFLLGGARMSWAEPAQSWAEPVQAQRPKLALQIPNEEAKTQEGDSDMEEESRMEEESDATQAAQGAVADQDGNDEWEEFYTTEFLAEFDRQDREAASLAAAAEESEVSEEE